MCMKPSLGLRMQRALTATTSLVLLVESEETWVPPSERSVALRDAMEFLFDLTGEANDKVSKELPPAPEVQASEPVRNAADKRVSHPATFVGKRTVQRP